MGPARNGPRKGDPGVATDSNPLMSQLLPPFSLPPTPTGNRNGQEKALNQDTVGDQAEQSGRCPLRHPPVTRAQGDEHQEGQTLNVYLEA